MKYSVVFEAIKTMFQHPNKIYLGQVFRMSIVID